MADHPPDSTRRMVGGLLRGGLLLGTLLMATGLVLAFAEGRLEAHAVTLGQIPGMLEHGRPSALMAAGVLVLLATPIARVLLLVVLFARERDFRFAVVAAGVATLLVLGAFLSHF
jgi:uncharacterized membrane protein